MNQIKQILYKNQTQEHRRELGEGGRGGERGKGGGDSGGESNIDSCPTYNTHE